MTVVLDLLSIRVSPFLNLRARLNEEDIAELMQSIRRYGVLHPIIVRRPSATSPEGDDADFEIVCGHRRYQACQNLGMKSVPCTEMVLNDQEALEVALTENVQRQNLDAIEEAEGFKLYICSYGRGSVSRLARKLGKSEEYVSHRLLLLGLPTKIKERISRRLLNASAATELVWLKDSARQVELADATIGKNMSQRQVREAVRILKKGELSTEEAVDKVVYGAVKGSPSKLDGFEERSEQAGDWSESILIKEPIVNETEILDRAILNIRACLAGLDMLVGATKASETRGLLIRQRFVIHASIDELLRESTKFQRRARQLA